MKIKNLFLIVIQIFLTAQAFANKDNYLFCFATAQKNWGYCGSISNPDLKMACISASMRLWPQCNNIKDENTRLACMGAGQENWAFCGEIKDNDNLARACDLGAKKFWGRCDDIK